ncbi:hypothetical protein P167DRAFT_574348 [Morchella conica CCBAS932]|uniref:Uncharacterized protein n=1 Tax=Morchella conica CCBAS932 TaxID=1392247 RepID=A0A3N4KSP7_9PEZI|nr:hypothetical protein P167DRAFT_574348 [Morchella conica CCBAS932]
MPASLIPITLHAFAISHITTRLTSLTTKLQDASRLVTYYSSLPRRSIPLPTLISISRALRNTQLSLGLHILVDDILEKLLVPDIFSAAQLAHHRVVVRDYETALEGMNQARDALVDLAEREIGAVDEKVVGDPVDVGMGTHVLSTALYCEEREEDQVDVVMGWMWSARKLFLETFGAAEGRGGVVVASLDIV